jgi:DNA-binding MarR family transcriptional regulator
MLEALRYGPQSTGQIADDIPEETYDSAHSRAKKLEARNFIRRIPNYTSQKIVWELTQKGREAIA